MEGRPRMSNFRLPTAQKGSTKVEFLDIVTAIIVLAILVYAASRQFPAYRNIPSSIAPPTQTH